MHNTETHSTRSWTLMMKPGLDVRGIPTPTHTTLTDTPSYPQDSAMSKTLDKSLLL